MNEGAAVNASPLIYLARADLLDLLQLAGREVWVPTQVSEEILRRGLDDPTARALTGTEWLRAATLPDVPREVLAWGLGPGESAVIATCLAQPGCRAVIDDLQGRRCAKRSESRCAGRSVLCCSRSGARSSRRHDRF